MKTKLTILIFIVIFSSFNVYNQVVCHDNFTAATSTPVDGLNTGEGWSDSWSAADGSAIILDSLDMGFGLLKTSDPYLHAGSNISRPLNTDPDGPFAGYLHADSGFIGNVGDSLWFSYLLRMNTTTEGGISVGFGEEPGSNPNIQLSLNTDPKFWLKGSNLSHYPLQSADTLKVYFIAWKIKFTSATESEVSIYFNPPVGDDPGSPARVSKAYSSSGNGLKISHLQIISSGNTDIDEIRFGKTYADVAPEFPYDQVLTTLSSPENITATTMDIGGSVIENSTFIEEHGIEWKSETDYTYTREPIGSGSSTIRKTIEVNPGSIYTYRVYAIIADSVFHSDAVDYAVDLNIPGTPSFSNINMTSLKMEINPNDNPTGTEYAIFETVTNKYVTNQGILSSDDEVWIPNWGELVTISGLLPDADYTFKVKARTHGGGTASPFSDVATVHTLNFPLLNYSKTGFNNYTFYHDDYSPDPATLEFRNSETGTFASAAAHIVEQTDSTVNLSGLSDGEYWFRLIVNSGGTNHISDTLHLIHVNRTLNTSDYLFVDISSMQDVENGTEEFPFKTIQKAVDSAEMGNTIIIKEGVYREEVRINKQNLTFIPFGSDSVILNGSIPLYDWQPAGTGVYKTIMEWDITEHDYSNQVFIDGEMIFLTRWPKETSNDRINNPTWATFDEAKKSGNYFTFTDEELPEPTSQWVGAQIFINPSNPVHGHEGQGWSGTISSVSGKSFVVKCNLPEGDAGNWGVEAGNYYYLYNPDPDVINSHGGITSLLGYGEWWKNGDTLYVKTRNGSIPTSTIQGKNLVESKKFPFFFRPVEDGALQNITIKGFNMFATSITTDDNFNQRSTVSEAENVIIDNINAKYVMHTADLSGDWYHQWSSNSGIILSGKNCTLKNSRIDWSAASAVSAIGLNHKITNNVMTNINYHGTEPGVINFGGRNVTSKDFDIGYNTIMHTPHDGIVYQELLNSDINNPGIARIHHNYLYNTMTQYFDLGVIKGAGQYGQWIRIDHNVIHNEITYGFGNARAGLYFDYGSDQHDDKSLFIVDHNVIYNIEQAILLNHLNGIKIYNNTLFGKKDGIYAGAMSSLGKEAYIQNNVYNSIGGSLGNATKIHNYIPTEDEWQTFFTDTSAGNFTLTPEADSLINQGTDVSPWNDPLIGKPDIGAYEYGTPAWKAGANLPARQVPYLGIPWDMPDTIQAEDYDIGGIGVAYADSSAGNLGYKYREDDVDITSTSDVNGGYKVYETKDGEWLEYTIDVPNSGTYSVVARIASLSDGILEISIGDSTTGEMSFTATGGEETWTDITKTGISLDHGKYVVRVTFKSDNIHLNYIALVAENTIPLYKLVTTSENGRINLLPSGNFYDEGTLVTMIAEPDGGYQFDNWSGETTGTGDSITITMDGDKNITANFSLIPQDPFGGIPWPVPGKIEVEDYDVGGQNISYYDNTPGNHYNIYRDDDVDIHELNCNSLGVGRQASGEWKEYTINVSETGTYNIDVSYAAPSGAGGSMEMYFDKNDASTGTIEIPDNTASWRDCGTITVEGVTLEAGEQIMTINPLSGGFNLNYVFIYDPGNIPLYTVNTIVAPVETGTIEIEPVSENYIYNSTVTFTAIPADGYVFESWAGDIMLDNNPATVSVLEDMEVIANFISTPKYELAINVLPAEGGIVTLTPQGGTYEDGTEVTISASPNDDYKFIDWSGDASGISTEITVTMNENKSITANFKSTVGILTNENNILTFYPNPVNNKLNLVTNINGSYEIMNIMGKVVKQGLIHNTHGSPWIIDVNDLEKGIYLLQIKGKEQAKIVRFVKN